MGGDNSNTYGHTYSDRIIIHSGEKGEHSLLIFSNLNGSSKITYSQNGGTEVSANVALATVKTDIGMSFKAEGGIDGGEKLNSRLVAVSTDGYGKVNATAGSGSMGTNGGVGGAATVSSSGSSAGGSSGTYTTYFLAGLSPSFDPAT